MGALLASLLAGYVEGQLGQLEAAVGGRLDAAVVVPSGRHPAPDPMAEVVARAWALTGPPGVGNLPPLVPGALRLAGATVRTRRCEPRPVVATPVARRDLGGRGVLLLDDTLTTGATAQSAAAALSGTGAAVVVLVLGRVVRPTLVTAHADYWQRVVTAALGARTPGQLAPGRGCGDAQAAGPGAVTPTNG